MHLARQTRTQGWCEAVVETEATTRAPVFCFDAFGLGASLIDAEALKAVSLAELVADKNVLI
jgi:hypothetical protein